MKELILIGILNLAFCAGMPKDGAPPPLLWYIPHSNISSRNDCKDHADSGNQIVEGGPVFVHPNQTSLCVYFSMPDKWFLHQGIIGPCAGSCCEWLPPVGPNGKYAEPSPSFGITWYEIASEKDDCLTPEKAKEIPQVLEGKVGENRTVCTTDPKLKDEFFKITVTLSLCGGTCCLF